MSREIPLPGPKSNPVAEKSLYSRAARKRLGHSREKLDGLTIVIRKAVAVGRLPSGPELDLRLEVAEQSYRSAEARLRLLQKSDPGNWRELRVDLERAWEDLAHATEILATHFSNRIDTENDET